MQRGTITANGKPVAGASVVWMGSATDYLLKTDAEGHYSVPDPSKWANRLIVVHPDHAMVDDVALGPRMTPKLDRILTAGSTITGRVLAEDGKTGVAKPPILIDDFPAGVTADDGTFTIVHAPANWDELQARSGNLAGVRARAGTGALNVRLAKSVKISGNVRDAKSQLPVVNAEVRLGPEMMAFGRRMRGFFGGGGPAIESVLTDAKGNFTITAPAGRYTLSAVYPGSTVATAPVSLTAGQSLNKTLYAAARGHVTGTVIDEDRRPVAGARLAADAVRRGGGPMAMIAPRGPSDSMGYSGPDGKFVLRNVLTDTEVEVDAAKKGFPTAHSATLKFNPGEKKSGI